MRRAALAALLLAAIHCTSTTHAVETPKAAMPGAATPQAATAADELVDHWGDSPQTAVSVPADAPNGGVDYENKWIFEQFGRFQREGGGTGTLEGRRYNIVKIQLENGDTKTVYFDITDLWARSQ